MTVEEGHVVNIDGSGGNKGTKYRPVSDDDNDADASGRPVASGVGRNSLFATDDEEFGAGGGGDRLSVLSRTGSVRSKTNSQLEATASAEKLPWYKGITFKDIRDIMPTLLILIGGFAIMIFVIPYAFSSVIRQLEAEKQRNREKAAEAAAKAAEKFAKMAANVTKAAMGAATTAATTTEPEE